MAKSKPKVYISFFGQLKIKTEHGIVTENDIHSNHMSKLIAYLVLNRKTIISSDILTAILWTQGTDDPYGNLRGLVCRLRKILKPAFPYESFIVAKNGSYEINKAFNLVVDAEQLSVISKYNINSAAAKSFLDNSCYPFMENLSSDIWGLPVVTYYNSRMITYVSTAVSKMIDEFDYDSAILYAAKGLVIDPLSEELHILIITALIKKGCRKLAIDHYNNTITMFRNEYSVTPDLAFKNMINKILYG